ncbi:MAG: hypothetical protein KAS66_08315 [Candidatus Omnitrophica bacterium]|nr:hypothetical protein [Candidatus Omnitrophota bacterium]
MNEKIVWIDSDNFDTLEGYHSPGLEMFSDADENSTLADEIELRVDYNTLDAKQKKALPKIPGDFKVYCNEKSRPPPSLKDRVVKERFFAKSDIIPLIKMILKESNREKVLQALIKENISPIVLEIWLLRPFSVSRASLEVLMTASQYIYRKETYYYMLANNFTPNSKVKFIFPKKVRG